MHEIHEDILNYLLQYKEGHPEFTFGLRKQNNSNRLKKGYWFTGDDRYLAIPFWTGRDWKNRTPNIFFKVERDGSAFLEFSFLDSPDKRLLIDRVKENIKGIEKYLRGYIKDYRTTDYLLAIQEFLTEDKPKIDALIKLNAHLFYAEKKRYNRIDFFSESEFESMWNKIELFRDQNEISNLNLPEGITGIKIYREISPKLNVEIENIPESTRWIFFTGNNGLGKSTILKSITATILGGRIPAEPNEHHYSLIPDSTKVLLTVNAKSGNRDIPYITEGFDQFEFPFSGISAYGPIRVGNPNMLALELPENETHKRLQIARSLFFEDAMMYNVDMELLTHKFADTQGILNKEGVPKSLIYDIIELMPLLIPNLIRIEAPMESSVRSLWTETLYILEDDEGNEFDGVNIEELSSGHKSLINLIGDMLIRLITQQSIINTLDELKGVVIIDEIDIHLHPINQKALVEGLSDALPNVQFIVSTHSPIPLLGAPKESEFYVVERRVSSGITARKLDIDPQDLLPNTILSSPIFGMQDLTNPEFNDMKLLKSKDDYNEFVFYTILDSLIDKSKKNNNAKD
ncbi:MAG TPA: AAA family ATPase [Brumimicrobium sp.]|nr:AAA family ATPase [Brumimicrobium sp.]